VRALVALALAAALAGCASSGAGAPPAAIAASPAFAANANPVCPAPNKIYAVGKASAKMPLVTAYVVLGAVHFNWVVTFKDQPSSAAPVNFVPVVYGCGAAGRGWGSARVSGGSLKSSCTNGVCTVAVTENVIYTPPAKAPPPALPLKFVYLKFAPAKRTPGYGLMNGALIFLRLKP